MLSKVIPTLLSLLLLVGAAPMAVGQPESDDRSSASIVAAVTRADRMAKAVPVQYTQSTQRADWITAEEAEALALEAVGLAREEVQFPRTELDNGERCFRLGGRIPTGQSGIRI